MRVTGLLFVLVTCSCTAPTEGNGTTVAESEGTSEGDTTTEGEDETTTEGEGETTTEGEGETPTEGESETTTDSETSPFDSAVQYYCLGGCRVSNPSVGTDDCDQADADQFCQLLLDDPSATATSWESATIVPGPGFCCSEMGWGETVTALDLDICWESDDLVPEHGDAGVVILRESLSCSPELP